MDAIDLCFEDELLLSCARREINSEPTKSRIAEGIDWSLLVQRAFCHRVIPLLYQNLSRLPLDVVPKEVLQQLQRYYRANINRNLYLTSKLLKLIDWLWSYQISAIPYKGPVMAAIAYGNIGLRQFGDLDILVHERNYELTRSLLLEIDFRLSVDWGWECSLVDDTHGVCVDLHRRVAPNEFPVHLDFDRLQNRLESITIAGRKIRTLCAEDMLIVLCIQLAKDGWANYLKLCKVCDIAELLRVRTNIDWEWILQETKRLGCMRMLYLSLDVAHNVLNAPVPGFLRRQIVSAHISALRDATCDQLFRENGSFQHARLSRESFHFKVHERWPDKIFSIWLSCKTLMTPNERDFAMLAIPESFDFLYYLVRPVRLARDYWLGLYAMLKKKWFTLKGLL